MMRPKASANPILCQILEFGPPIAFFVLYLWLRDQTFDIGGIEYSGFIVATVAFVPLLLFAIGLLWWLTGQLSRMQVFTAVLVILFGALTAWFNDERFFKIKTTVVYGGIAAVLALGLLQKKSYLEWLLAEAIPMTHTGWMKFTRRVILGFVLLAVANEIVWRTLSTDAWVKIETFGFPVFLITFLGWQIYVLRSELIEDQLSSDQ